MKITTRESELSVGRITYLHLVGYGWWVDVRLGEGLTGQVAVFSGVDLCGVDRSSEWAGAYPEDCGLAAIVQGF